MRAAPIVVPGRKVHIDGDYLCYYASGKDDTEPGQARMNALSYVHRAKVATGSETAIMHLTASGSHKGERYLAATVKPYQGQRSGDRRPSNWRYLRDWTSAYVGPEFVTKSWATREADDGIAACADWAARRGKPDAICTADKDMQMLPGLHLDWKDHTILTEVPLGAWEVIGDNEKVYGERWFWLQMLQGDSADNIPGLEFIFAPVVPGRPERMTKVGPAGAKKLLWGVNSSAEAAKVVTHEYWRTYRGQSEHTGYDRFVEQAALLWLRRDNAASLGNFADYFGDLLSDKVHLAVARLVKRVAEARREADALTL